MIESFTIKGASKQLNYWLRELDNIKISKYQEITLSAANFRTTEIFEASNNVNGSKSPLIYTVELTPQTKGRIIGKLQPFRQGKCTAYKK